MLENHLRELGYFPDHLSLDGKIHRFDRNGKKNAWIVGYQNHTNKGDVYVVARFGDWKTGENETFKSNLSFTPHEKKLIEDQIAKTQKLVEAERLQSQLTAASEAAKFWETCQDNSSSEYLTRKKIKNLYGAKTYLNGAGRNIIVPMRDVEGKLWGYQEIYTDGTKRFGTGQKKSGNFFTFGDIQNETIYICEGYATGASIFEAICACVIVAFDAKNLEHVATALYQKYPDKKFVICGDEDLFIETNVGRECGEKAAKSCLGKVIFPKFLQNSAEDKKTDFNDLSVYEGVDAVREQILGVLPEKHTVKYLGYDGDEYCFISSQKPQVTRISASGFSKNSLLNLMDTYFWEARYPSKRTLFNLDQAVNDLMSGCRKVGVFRSEKIRGTGVWQDQGRTVVNLGDRLYVDGIFLNFSDFKTRFIYESGHIITPPRVDYLSCGETLVLKRLIDQLSWKNPTSSKILLGWLYLSGICGSISWRPHIWITGAAGSGKTTVMKEIVGRLSPHAIQVLGKTTDAGIRQIIGSNCLPLMFDENEVTDQKSMHRVSGVIDLFRIASSETDAQVYKGTPSGKAIQFSVRFMAAVSSISVGLNTEQDLSRFSILEMVTNKNNGFMDKGGVRDQLWTLLSPDFCDRFWSRSVFSYSRWKENFKTLYPILMKRVSARYADQYGSLMAGYYTAIMDQPLSDEEAYQAASEDFIHVETESRDEDSNELKCLDYILGLKISDSGKSFSVARIIELLNTATPEQEEYFQTLLMTHGLKYLEKHLYVRFSNPQLKSLMRDSEWPLNWGRILKRIDGCECTTSRFFGKVEKVTKISLVT